MPPSPLTYARILADLGPSLSRVEDAIRENLHPQSELAAAIDRHIIASGGKRFRPMLMLLAARLFGYRGEGYLTLAAVIEYLHSATLLHDDVLDEAALRRGNPSANNRWGNTAAVLAGDWLFSQAFALLVRDHSRDITLTMLQAAMDMIDGEVLELSHRRDATLSPETYTRVIDLKTASLIAASCRVGALLGGADQAAVDAMEEYGRSLGLAFQIIDDVLDYAGETDKFGKVRGGDLREGTVTLPLILLLPRLSPEQRELVIACLGVHDLPQERVGRVVDLMREQGVLDEATAEAGRRIARAKELLRSLPDTPPRAMLETAADYVASRTV